MCLLHSLLHHFWPHIKFHVGVCVTPACIFHHSRLGAWWRHQMETFSALLALCAGNSPVTCEFPSQRRVARSFDVFLICAWINGWVNNREAGDLRRHGAHYDVTVMWFIERKLESILSSSKHGFRCPFIEHIIFQCIRNISQHRNGINMY